MMTLELQLAATTPVARLVGTVPVLAVTSPVDLTVREGEFLSLIGPSGCGKSTLLSLVANLSEPSDGRLLWWRGGFN